MLLILVKIKPNTVFNKDCYKWILKIIKKDGNNINIFEKTSVQAPLSFTSATILQGPPLPPSIFIGNTITLAPVVGSFCKKKVFKTKIDKSLKVAILAKSKSKYIIIKIF